jgi:two-component system LytT family response regulator
MKTHHPGMETYPGTGFLKDENNHSTRLMNSSLISIKTTKGIEILKLEDVLCCFAHGRYSRIMTVNGKEYMLAKTLKEIEEFLPGQDFFRTHKSFLINMNYIIH